MMNSSTSNTVLAAALVFAIAVVLYFEWHTDESIVVLAVLVVVALGVGWFVSTNYVIVGVSLGSAIVTAHALSSATGMMIPRYQKHAFSAGDWVTMAMLIVPAILASYAGSRLAKRS